MNEDKLNLEIRQFLKKVGVTSQREIEHAILRAMDNGQLTGIENIDLTVTLTVPKLDIHHQLKDTLHLS